MTDETKLPANDPPSGPPADGEGAEGTAQELMPWDTAEQPPAPEIDLLPPDALPVIAEVLAFLADIGAAAQDAEDQPN